MMQKQKLHLIRGVVILIGGITTLDGASAKGQKRSRPAVPRFWF
jgi:hypothetical protein